MEAILDDSRKNTGFEFEFVDYSEQKNNGFDVESVSFDEFERQTGVKTIDEMNRKEEKVYKKTEYIELDYNLGSTNKQSTDEKKIFLGVNTMKKIKENIKNARTKSIQTKLNLGPVIDVINFDSLTGAYIINYHELGKMKEEKYSISKKNVFEGEHTIKEKIIKWGETARILRRIDMNLYSALSKFDLKHNTTCARDYIHEKTKYIANYDMRNIFENKEYSFKEKISLIISANRQKLYRNATVLNPKEVRVFTTFTSFALLCGILGFGVLNAKNNTNTANVNSSKIVSEIDNEDNKVDEKVVKTSTEEVTEIISLEEPTVVLEEKRTEVKEIKPEVIAEKETTESFNINDKVVLGNMNLNYSPVESIKSVNTEALKDIASYEISLISAHEGNIILSNDKVENLKDKSLSCIVDDLIDEYGTNIDINVNFDGYDKDDNQQLKYVGWANILDINLVETDSNKQKIQELKKVQEKLKELKSNNSSTNSVQKVKK